MERPHLSPLKQGIVGVQFLFVAFGATVLVPLLVGLDPATALFSAGVGTFIFHLVTKGKVPIFLGSSFAFIAPIIAAKAKWGLPGTLAGLISVAFVYFLVAALVKWQGKRLLDKFFPPVVIGPVIIIIGLSLAPSGVDMAKTNWGLAAISLVTAVAVLSFTKGLIKLVPVLCGIIVGYIAACLMGVVDFQSVIDAPWFALPSSIANFQMPQLAWEPILYMLPVAIAPVIEHIGNVYTTSAVAEKDFANDPGLHKTLFGDGLACAFSAFIAGPPVTTYSEVTGAMQITRIVDPKVIRIAAFTAVVFALLGKVSAILQSIPASVLGGIMLLLFGTIASVGIQNLMQSKIDFSHTRNIVIVAVTLSLGIGGATLSAGSFEFGGIGLAAVVAVVLNLVLPKEKAE